MSHYNPTGGLVDILRLNPNNSPIYYQDLSDAEDHEPGSGAKQEVDTESPLVAGKTKKRRVWISRISVQLSRVNWKRVNSRTRLVLRAVSLIASGTTFGSLGSALYSYNATKTATHPGGNIWPPINLHPTVVMLSAAVVTFAADLAFFGASAKAVVRKLETPMVKTVAMMVALVCGSFCIAGVTVGEVLEIDSHTDTLMWTCFAKKQTWDETVTVDFPFLCGEVVRKFIRTQ